MAQFSLTRYMDWSPNGPKVRLGVPSSGRRPAHRTRITSQGANRRQGPDKVKKTFDDRRLQAKLTANISGWQCSCGCLSTLAKTWIGLVGTSVRRGKGRNRRGNQRKRTSVAPSQNWKNRRLFSGPGGLRVVGGGKWLLLCPPTVKTKDLVSKWASMARR